ncbi:1611_t:CDS:2, partial [Entrophospora sp. SA101]
MAKNSQLFDFSNYPKTHPLYNVENKAAIGLRAKMYAFEIENRQITKKAKDNIYRLRVENHNIYLTKSTKKVLCPLDTKKWILDDRINSYAYGHYKIQDPNDNVEEIKYSDEELCNFLELILT